MTDLGRSVPDGLSSLRDEAGKPSSPEASIPSALVPSRYPYTYSADYIRGITENLVLARADAAHILTVLSETIGFDRVRAACDLADAYLADRHPEIPAPAIEARRAATLGAVHESAVTEGEALKASRTSSTPPPSQPGMNRGHGDRS